MRKRESDAQKLRRWAEDDGLRQVTYEQGRCDECGRRGRVFRLYDAGDPGYACGMLPLAYCSLRCWRSAECAIR